jgi:RNA polymerase sigma-70 factor (ECF subfamily)
MEAVPATARDEPPTGRNEGPDFEVFFEREYARLFRALVLVTRNTSDAEELTQEAFARVWERWDRIGRMDDPVGYLYRTAMSRYLQAHRRAMVAIRHRTSGSRQHDVLAQVDDLDLLERLLLQLPPRQRAALVVRELLGYDSTEAGRILGVRPGTVRRLASQAMARLREGGAP